MSEQETTLGDEDLNEIFSTAVGFMAVAMMPDGKVLRMININSPTELLMLNMLVSGMLAETHEEILEKYCDLLTGKGELH
jgi:hypothetical protein